MQINRLEILKNFVKGYYDYNDPAHDWEHINRVIKTVQELSFHYKVYEEYIFAATYCHDIENLPKNDEKRKYASFFSAQKAYEPLFKSNFKSHEIKIIQEIIKEHSFSKGVKPSTLEAAILQDADRLDALGAIGILRCTSISALIKGRYYHPMDPFGKERDLDEFHFVIDHFFQTLFKLPNLMNTPQAKKMAEQRIKFMQNFIDQISGEIN